MSKQKNLLVLSVLASLCVVCLHCNFSWTYFTTYNWWFTSCIIRGICYPAVPIFLMISGATLLDYKSKYDTKTFFKKRIRKVLIPYLAWSAFAIVYAIFRSNHDVNTLTVKSVINAIINYKYQDVFWYFPVCISIYLCMPLFASVDNKSKKSVFSYLAIAYFILNCLYPFLNTVLNIGIKIPYSIYVLTNYSFYCIVGWLINNFSLSKLYRYIIYVLGLLGFFAETFGTYFYSIRDGKINETFLGYTNLPCVLYAVALFVLFKQISDYLLKNDKVYKVFDFIGKYTFSIYLLHNFVRNFIVHQFHPSTVSIWWRTVGVIPIVIICMIITWFLRKIPILKHIVP